MKNKHTMLPKKVKEVIVMLGITITYIEKDMKNGSKMTMCIKHLINLHQNMSVIYG